MLFSGRSLFSFLFLYPFILLILNFIQPTSNILLSLFYPHNLHHFPSNLEITSFFSMSVFFFFYYSLIHFIPIAVCSLSALLRLPFISPLLQTHSPFISLQEMAGLPELSAECGITVRPGTNPHNKAGGGNWVGEKISHEQAKESRILPLTLLGVLQEDQANNHSICAKDIK